LKGFFGVIGMDFLPYQSQGRSSQRNRLDDFGCGDATDRAPVEDVALRFGR
jgi:hypothetical protein